MSLENNAQGKPSVRITLPTAGAIASIAGVVIWIVGFSMGYLTFKSEMGSLREQVGELRSGKPTTDGKLDALGNRLTSIETELRYLSQAAGSNTIRQVPK